MRSVDDQLDFDWVTASIKLIIDTCCLNMFLVEIGEFPTYLMDMGTSEELRRYLHFLKDLRDSPELLQKAKMLI